MNALEVFSKNMRRYRKAAGLTQEQLAERCGLHRTYIGRIEQQRVNVSINNAGRIADALGVSMALLFVDYQDDEILAPRESRDVDADGESKRAGPSAKRDASGGPDVRSAATSTGSSTAQDREVRDNRSTGKHDTSGKNRTSTGRLPVASNEGASQDKPEYQYALCKISENKVELEELEVEDPDLTVQILCSLVADGYEQDELASEYKHVEREILDFLHARERSSRKPVAK